MIDLDQIAAIQANGNYTKVVYMTGREITLTSGVSKVAQYIAYSVQHEKSPHFVKLGRSIIINQNYLLRIDLQKQVLVLSNGGKAELRVRIPKNVLRSYKELIEKQYKSNPS